MVIRFVDARGTEWEVWEEGVRTTLADHRPPRSRRTANGDEPTLCFESATQRRRLSRYSNRWHAMLPRELDAMCQAATPTQPLEPVFAPWVARAD